MRNSFHSQISEEYGGDPPTQEEIIKKILSIQHRNTRTYVILAYLSAGRVSEIVRYITPKFLKKQKTIISFKDDEVIKDTKKWQVLNPKWEKNNYMIEGIRPVDITFFEKTIKKKKKKFLKIHMRNEKNKSIKVKNQVCPVEYEGKLIDQLMKDIKDVKPFKPILPYDRTWIFKLLKKYAGFFYYPHFIRGLRATHLVQLYNFDGIKLMKFMGWKDTRPYYAYEVYKVNTGIINAMSRRLD